MAHEDNRRRISLPTTRSAARGCKDAPLRTLLFVPGNATSRIAKAIAAGADVVIIDLEDSVAPDTKDSARHNALAALEAAERAVPIAVRVNAEGTEWHLRDLAEVCPAAPDYIMMPKCESMDHFDRLSARLDVLETASDLPLGTIGILPLVTETAAAVDRLDYQAASSRLAALCFAGEDLAADLGIFAREDNNLNPLLERARYAVAHAAAVAGVPAIDTPFPDPADADGLAAEAKDARRLGYAGKLCIHPCQVAPVRDLFRPSDRQLDWAREVVAALAREGSDGVSLLNGKMIDGAHLRLARRLLTMSAEPQSVAAADL